MKTIAKGFRTVLLLSLNRSVANAAQATLTLTSPSRATLTFTNSLTDNGSGYFSFELSNTETAQLEDDTYKYELTQGSNYLKTGYIRLVDGEVVDGVLDGVLNSLLA